MSAKGVPTSECLREGWTAPSNVTIKDFARWYRKSRSSLLAEVTLVSVNNTLKKFCSGFEPVTGMKISDELRTDFYFVSPVFDRP